MDRVKLRWLNKIRKTKNFVILTDNESVICLKGLDPEKFLDLMELASQTATLEQFRDDLTLLIHRHEQATKKLKEGE